MEGNQLKELNKRMWKLNGSFIKRDIGKSCDPDKNNGITRIGGLQGVYWHAKPANSTHFGTEHTFFLLEIWGREISDQI